MVDKSLSTQRGVATDLLTIPIKTRCRKAQIHTPLKGKNRMNYLLSSSLPFLSSFPICRDREISLLRCATQKPNKKEDMVEGGRDRKGEGTEARGPPLLPNQENTRITQHCYESKSCKSIIPRSALAHFQEVLTSRGSHVKRMKIHSENDPSDSSPTNCQHANTASAFQVIPYSSPACSA